MEVDRRALRMAEWPDEASWHKRPSEPKTAYTAFLIFLSLEPTHRTVANAYRNLMGIEEPSSPGHMGQKAWRRWALHFAWNERATDYERWKKEEQILAAELEAAAESARWAEVRNEHRNEAFEVGKMLIEKAKAMLKFPLAEVEKVITVYEDGKPREVSIVKPGKWTFGTIAQLVDAGDKLVRLAAEMDTQRSTVNLRLLHEEADEIAKANGLTRNDVLAMADRIVRERWPEHTPEEA